MEASGLAKRPKAHHNFAIRSVTRSRCRVLQDSFFIRVIHVWNGLPSTCVEAKSLSVFRSRIDAVEEKHLLPNRRSLLRFDYVENCRVVGCKCKLPNLPLKPCRIPVCT